MTVYASDTFTRADNASSMGTAETGGAWTAHFGTWGIINNAAYRPGGTADNHQRVSLAIAQSDVTVSCDVGLSVTLNRAYAGILLRYANATNHIQIYLAKTTAVPNSILLQQTVAGVETTLASVTSAGLANNVLYNLKAVISGTTIAVYLDGVLKIAATSFNAGLTTQNYGLAMYRGSTDYDNALSFYDNFLITDNESSLIPRLNPLLNANIYRM